MELLAAAAIFVVAVIPGWCATAWLLWRVRSLKRAVHTLESRLARLETQPPPVAPDLAAPEVDSSPAAPEPNLVTPEAVPAASQAVRHRATAADSETLESWIGGQWLLYIGVLAILVGVAYFEKLAFESAWLGETARVVQGAAAGLLLVYGGIRFARAGYTGYGHAIAGAGVAALYVST